MTTINSSVCKGGSILVFACSGAADVGAVADQAAREMSRNGVGSMFCMGGIGGRVEPIMKKTAAADRILAIDGCPLNCVKATLEQAGFTSFEHLQLADLGMDKGSTPASSENIRKAAEAGAALLQI
ncbi:MAG: putative zinc-binding protein [Pontiellaceae bacterium]|nr:putative zinc-binding protein [Pontiellaceae bacterium]MBN2786409.1 putative zinc-binding protein [Pontiellaceae bacterium]